MIRWVHIQHGLPTLLFAIGRRNIAAGLTAEHGGTSGLFSAAMRRALCPMLGTIILAGKHRGDREQLRDLAWRSGNRCMSRQRGQLAKTSVRDPDQDDAAVKARLNRSPSARRPRAAYTRAARESAFRTAGASAPRTPYGRRAAATARVRASSIRSRVVSLNLDD